MIETSIIIPVRNQKNSLLAALESLRRQIKKPRSFEIVICDDDSSDGTGDIVKKLRYPIFFKYFINTPPLGRAANRNRGVERSVGKRMIFIDGDMVSDEGFIEAMLSENNADAVKIGNVKPPPDEKLSNLDKYLYSRGRFRFKNDETNLPGRFFTSNNFSISRAAFEKIGGFDNQFAGWGGEDIDFGLRLEKAGIAINCCPDAVTYHYHKRSIKSLTTDFYEFGFTSFSYLIKKHPEFLDQIKANKLGIAPVKSVLDVFYKVISLFAVNVLSLKLAAGLLLLMKKVRCPDFIYDYVFWGNLARGYKKRSLK